MGRCLVGLNVQVSVPKYIFSLSDGVALLDVTMDTVDATYESVVAQYVQSNFRAEVLKVLRAQPGYASSGSTFDDFEVIASVQDYRVVTPDTGGGEEGGGNEEEDEGGGGDGGSFTMKRLTSTTVDVLIAMAAFYLLLAACVCCFRLSNTSSAGMCKHHNNTPLTGIVLIFWLTVIACLVSLCLQRTITKIYRIQRSLITGSKIL